MIWTLVSILVILWIIGLLAHIGGGIIHALLVIAIIVVIYKFVTNNRPKAL